MKTLCKLFLLSIIFCSCTQQDVEFADVKSSFFYGDWATEDFSGSERSIYKFRENDKVTITIYIGDRNTVVNSNWTYDQINKIFTFPSQVARYNLIKLGKNSFTIRRDVNEITFKRLK